MVNNRNNAIEKLADVLLKSSVFRFSKFFILRKDNDSVQSKIATNETFKIRPVEKKEALNFPNISKGGRANIEKNFGRGVGGMAAAVGDKLIHWSLYTLNSGYQEMIESKILLNPGSALIFSVYTHPDYRGKNIGGQVLRTLCRNLGSKGIKRFYVFIHVYNHSSVNLFTKVGFQKIGSVTFLKLFNLCFSRMKGDSGNYSSEIREIFRTPVLRCKKEAITLS